MSTQFKTHSVLGLALFLLNSGLVYAYNDSEIRAVQDSSEAQVVQVRAQEVEQIRIALGRRLAGHRQAELYFRLAQAYFEAYRNEFIFEGRVHERRIERGARNELIDRSRSKAILKRGIQACEELIKLKIPFDRMDEVYYFVAFNASELGDKTKSRAAYQTIIDRYPRSGFASEAHRALGEEDFMLARYSQAYDHLRRAAASAPVELLPRVLYRLAWAQYRMRSYAEAVKTMIQAIQKAQETGEKYLALKEEALRDLALFYTETGQVDAALSTFDSVAGDKKYFPKMLEQLGRQFDRSGKVDSAKQVYQALLKTHPESEPGFRVRVKLFELEQKRGRAMEALTWAQSGEVLPDGDEETIQSFQRLKVAIRKTAVEFQKQAREKKTKEALKTAEAYYVFYIDKILKNKGPETLEIQMYLAEVKRDLGDEVAAAKLYQSVLESKDPKYSKEAGQLWVGSLDAQLQARKTATGIKKGEAPSELERQFVEASDFLLKTLSLSPQVLEAQLKSAQILAGYTRTLDQGEERANWILKEAPNSPQAKVAAALLLQGVSDQVPSLKNANDSGVEKIIRNTREQMQRLRPFIANADTLSKLELRLGALEVARAEKDQRWVDAGKGYEAIAAKEKTPKLWMAALQVYARAEDWDKVLQLAPKAEAKDWLRGQGSRLVVAGKWQEALRVFEWIAWSADPKSPDTGSAKLSLLLSEGLESPMVTQEKRRRLARALKSGAERNALWILIGQNSEKAGQSTQALKDFEQCESQAECLMHQAEIYERAKDFDKSFKIIEKVAAFKSKEASIWIGQARFKVAEKFEKQQPAVRLTLPESALKKSLGLKIDQLQKLSQRYKAVIDAGGPWALAASERLALWTLEFARELESLQGSEQLKKSTTELAAGLKNKAVLSLQQGYQVAVKNELFSSRVESIVKSIEGLAASPPRWVMSPLDGFKLAGIAPSDNDQFERVRAALTENANQADVWIDYGNLLWGSGKRAFAQIAYDRALALAPHSASALNNQGVLLIKHSGTPSLEQVYQAGEWFKQALKSDPLFIAAKWNRAILLSHFGLYEPARQLWEQVLVKLPDNRDAKEALDRSVKGLEK